jgi:CubicO group peptidase (beta-lactamase class C family)
MEEIMYINKNHSTFNYALLLLFLLIVAVPIYAQEEDVIKTPEYQDTTSAHLQENMEKLCDQVEAKMEEYQIPGLAIAVIIRDKILLCRGFGLADMEKNTLVTDETVFPIGSSTKPFTSTLTAMLVTDGTMSWDDPIFKYLPEFQLKIMSNNDNDYVTIRDLLSHRTGFFHMDLVGKAVNWEQDPNWGIDDESQPYTRFSLLRAAVEYDPKDTFRLKHNYSNISMLAVGVASGKAGGTNWDTLMAERMFRPLGMKGTSTSIDQIKNHPNLAVGYLMGEEGYEVAQLINMNVVSPAGGINSTIRDMALWMQFLLCDGIYDNKDLIGKEELHETWTKQIAGAEVGGLMPDADYGLGWFLREWNGYKVVEHAGNALGYSANIAMIPELGVGYVMLSNLFPNPLLGNLNEIVWEALIEN